LRDRESGEWRRHRGGSGVITDETLEQVREAADIVQIIGEHVALRKVGGDYRGPCPFHQGTHPNFSVSPRKRMYYCFVCHEGGDVFTFLSKRLGLDWPSAVRQVAGKAGIEIREVETHRSGPDPREPLWEVTGSAADYFRRMLWDDETGRPARDYLASRHIDRETADRFGLGFAPPAIGLMRSYLQTLGFDDERQITAGVLSQPEEGREPRPRFRGRLIFPIFDAVGHTVGFGGRLIGSGDVKYVNSPESAVFAKRRLLYGLNWAKFAIRREERVLLVEGYFDVVRLMAAGIESVVAPLGTALTTEQTELLARYTKQVFLLYDSDAAGLRATFRAGDELLRRGLAVRVVTLPAGEDPDTFVDTHGAERLDAEVAAAPDLFDRKVALLEEGGWFADLHRKRRAIDRLLPTIRAAADPITQELYVARASEAAGVPPAVLWREVGQQPPAPAAPDAVARAASPSSGRRPERRRAPSSAEGGERSAGTGRGGSRAAAERELVRALLFAPRQIDGVADRIQLGVLRDPRYRAIIGALRTLGEAATPDALAGVLSAEAQEIVAALGAEGPTGADAVRVIDDSLATLRVRELEDRQAEIDRLTVVASTAEKQELMMEKVRNRDEIRALHGRGYRTYGKSRQTAGRNDGAS
jgi:DNA primase